MLNFFAPAARQNRGYFEVRTRESGHDRIPCAPKARENFGGILTILRGKTVIFRVPNAPKARENLGVF